MAGSFVVFSLHARYQLIQQRSIFTLVVGRPSLPRGYTRWTGVVGVGVRVAIVVVGAEVVWNVENFAVTLK